MAVVCGAMVGMGNGMIFGTTVSALAGRSAFRNWGGDGNLAYHPITFTGFIDWSMIVFGLAFVLIMLYALYRDGRLEIGFGKTPQPE